MISQDQINAAVERLAQAAQPERILVFGSHARGEAREESDLDLLVIETEVPDRAAEMVRLRRRHLGTVQEQLIHPSVAFAKHTPTFPRWLCRP